MRQFITTVVAAFALVSAAGCGTSQITAPTPAGPSTSALALTMTTTPDSLTADGGSQSAVAIQASNAAGGPQVGLPIRLEIAVAGTLESCGTLSGSTVVTDSNGHAAAVYTAPSMPLPLQCSGFAGVVTVIATPSGSNFQTASSRSSSIRLTASGTILPPAGSPTAAFIVSPTPATAGLPLRFDASSSQIGTGATQISTYSWDFGDGTSASGKIATHTFASAASYSVTLTVTNDRGLSASTTQVIAVAPPATGTGTLPTPAFTVSPASPGVGATVFFNAATSTPGSGHTLASYSWTFGDGVTATGVNVTHAYPVAGTYTVQLTVTDEIGQSATSPGTTISVGAPTTTQPSPPSPSFSFSPAAPGVGAVVFFNASASTPGIGHKIVSYAWTFGDGGTATGVAPTHTYTAAGSYAVQLTATDEIGESTTTPGTTISVGSPPSPTASFTFSPAIPGVNDQVVFDASSSVTSQGQTIVDVAWNYGDGTAVVHCGTLVGNDPSCVNAGVTNRISAHTFMIAQTFIVNLVVTDTAGRIGSHNTSVTVVPALPVVSIVASPSAPNPGQNVNFNSSGTTLYPGSGCPCVYAWRFGDGSTSALANPTHPYAAVGTYAVGLSVTDNKGRTGVGNASVTVVAVTPPASPVAAFTSSPPSPSFATPPVFFDASTSTTPSGAAINNYRWNFGDGTINAGPPAGAAPGGGTYQAPHHMYAATGSYTVTLTVTDTNNLTGSVTQTVTVGP